MTDGLKKDPLSINEAKQQIASILDALENDKISSQEAGKLAEGLEMLIQKKDTIQDVEEV